MNTEEKNGGKIRKDRLKGGFIFNLVKFYNGMTNSREQNKIKTRVI